MLQLIISIILYRWFTAFKYFLIISQLTTLHQIEDDSIKHNQVINAGELWAKLYIQFLIKKYGKKWKIFHSTMDVIWVSFVTIGIIFTPYKSFFVGMVAGFWLLVGIFVYLPKLFK